MDAHGTPACPRHGFANFLDDDRIRLSNIAAKRPLRGIVLGSRPWLLAGSDRGGIRAATIYTVIGTALLNNIDPQAWLANVLAAVADTSQTCLQTLLPWHWEDERRTNLAA